MLEINREIFDRNLLLTQVYCEMQLANSKKSTAEILRSFNPDYNGKSIFSYKIGYYTTVSWAEEPRNSDLYDRLFEDQLLNKEQQIRTVDNKRQFRGRVLVAEIDTSVTDGASEDESEGFIDIYDCPPIDTWFHKTYNKTGRVFYAWVPMHFVELTQKAIEVNMLECFVWQETFLLRKEIEALPKVENPNYTIFGVLIFVILISVLLYLILT